MTPADCYLLGGLVVLTILGAVFGLIYLIS